MYEKLMTLFTLLLTFFAPIALIVYMIVFVVVLDCVVAILRQWAGHNYRHRGIWRFFEKLAIIRSRGLKRMVLKLILYILFIMSVYGSEIAVFNTSVHITNFTAFLIIFTELVSIAENIDLMFKTTKFTVLIRKVRKLFEDKLLDKITVMDENKYDDKINNKGGQNYDDHRDYKHH